MVVRNEVRAAVRACGVAAEREAAAFMAEWRLQERVYDDALVHDLPTHAAVDTSALEAAFSGSAAMACRRCGSSDVTLDNRQVRSKDEAETAFLTCRACGCKWRM